MKAFAVTQIENPEFFTDRVTVNEVKAYSINFAAWSEDNDDISAATWSVMQGAASISNQALIRNVTSADILFSQPGRVLIKVTGNGTTLVHNVFISVLAADNQATFCDYGL